MKKLFISAVVFSLVLFATSVLAGGWANFYVKTVGPYQTIDLVKLEPYSGGAGIYYRLKADRANELLATALTAITTGNPVRAYIEKIADTGHWSDYEVQSMFMGASVDDLT